MWDGTASSTVRHLHRALDRLLAPKDVHTTIRGFVTNYGPKAVKEITPRSPKAYAGNIWTYDTCVHTSGGIRHGGDLH